MYIGENVSTQEYAPALFEYIRRMDNITDAEVQRSLHTELNR